MVREPDVSRDRSTCGLLCAGLAMACSMWLCAAPPATAAPQAATAPLEAPSIKAVPYYQAEHFVAGLLRHGVLPRALAFQAEAAHLAEAAQALCTASPPLVAAALNRLRDHWRRTALAWDRLAPLAIGPMVERRSMRQIDFMPTRPALIERAIRAAPASAADMERVGTPAKGLPALEWLLWGRKPPLDASACRYGEQVAQEIRREADAIAQGFTVLVSHPPDDSRALMEEVVNQWVGGLERLHWARLEKPVRSNGDLPRHAGGLTVASWQAQWHTLRSLAVQGGAAAPAPGQGLVSLETHLRGRGLNPLADRLRQAVLRADPAVAALNLRSRSTLLAASRELAALKHLVETDVADALEVSMGFSDADGD